MTRIVVLNSGGVDSTTCVSIAIDRYGRDNVSTVSVHYGQRHGKELHCAERVAEYYGIPHHTLDLSTVFEKCGCPLLMDADDTIPHTSYSEQVKGSRDGVVPTYVPFRNGLLLSAVASYTMSLYPDDRVTLMLGNHADDSAGNAYPDCSEEFSYHMQQAIRIGTADRVTVECPFKSVTKKDVVRQGLELHTPYDLTWSCYEGGEKACGTCGTCRDRKEAFRANGVEDPIEYEVRRCTMFPREWRLRGRTDCPWITNRSVRTSTVITGL